jgi:SsrA-binding protein
MSLFVDNRRARHEYFLEEKIEAGIVLQGTEVRAIREKGMNIAESYIDVRDDGLYLVNAHVGTCKTVGPFFQHEPRRPRKLLLRGREIRRLAQEVQRNGMTIVPVNVHTSDRGLIKVTIALAKGKKNYDKRQSAKEADWKRDKARLMREKG